MAKKKPQQRPGQRLAELMERAVRRALESCEEPDELEWVVCAIEAIDAVKCGLKMRERELADIAG